MKYILKIYSHPRADLKGFTIFKCLNWEDECKHERNLDYKTGCSSMSQHETKQEAIDHARRLLPETLFNKCF